MEAQALNQCIIHGFGYLGSRIAGVVAGKRSLQPAWDALPHLPFRIVAIVDRDVHRLRLARRLHPDVPSFPSIGNALHTPDLDRTFIKEFTSPRGRLALLDKALSLKVPYYSKSHYPCPDTRFPWRVAVT